MRKSAALFIITLAFASIILASRDVARAQDAQEGPTKINQCQTISQPGSYKLINNLTYTNTTGVQGACITITVDFVTIDLAGFAITGPGGTESIPVTAIRAMSSSNQTPQGIAVRNGSISGFGTGVALGDGSIVEGLRIAGIGPSYFGIVASGIVRGNTVIGIFGTPGHGIGISASGTIINNYVIGSRIAEYQVSEGSTVIGNTANGNSYGGVIGIEVSCPSNVTGNTAINNGFGNLMLNGAGCNNTNNVAP